MDQTTEQTDGDVEVKPGLHVGWVVEQHENGRWCAWATLHGEKRVLYAVVADGNLLLGESHRGLPVAAAAELLRRAGVL